MSNMKQLLGNGRVCYISGPMRGFPDFNFPVFMEADEKLQSWEWNTINPAALDQSEGEMKSFEEYMRRDIRDLLDCCDSIVMLPGWEHSQGARTELLVADSLSLELYELGDNHLVPLTQGCAYDKIGNALSPKPTFPKVPTAQQTILDVAKGLVLGDRGGQYGHPAWDFGKVAMMANGLFAGKLSQNLTGPDIIRLMILVKLSREQFKPKEDTRIDIGGYALCLDMAQKLQDAAMAQRKHQMTQTPQCADQPHTTETSTKDHPTSTEINDGTDPAPAPTVGVAAEA